MHACMYVVCTYVRMDVRMSAQLQKNKASSSRSMVKQRQEKLQRQHGIDISTDEEFYRESFLARRQGTVLRLTNVVKHVAYILPSH